MQFAIENGYEHVSLDVIDDTSGQKAITWSNDDPNQWCMYASPSMNESNV